MWASNLSGNVSLGAKVGPRRQYRYSASEAALLPVQGQYVATKGRPPYGAGSTSTLYRDIQTRDHA
jgi:hypothetical protein